MASIADVFFSAILDDGRLQVDAKKAGDKAGLTMGQSLSASIKKSFSGGELGKGLVQGLGLAGAFGAANLAATGISALTDTVGDAINAASNLNETMTKSEVIFGDHADEMSAWADTASDSFGQSKRSALDTASGFAGLFDTVGIELDKATEMSKDLTVLGSDLASFFNTDVQTAIDALKSGLSGESEPLRRFNVFLSETAVNAKLVASGQQKVNGQWTEGQKALARYQLIIEQTTSAQGDFTRTQDGLANSTRTLQAQWEDALSEIGQVLLPLVTEGVVALSDSLDGLTGLITLLNGQLPETEDGFRNLQNILNFLNPGTHVFNNTLDDVIDAAEHVNVGIRNAGGSFRELSSNVGLAADSIGVDARDARSSIEGIGEGATDAAADVRMSASDILTSIANLRAGAVGDAEAAAAALYDPIIKQAELAETQVALTEARRIINSKDSTDEQIADAQRRVTELQKQLIIQTGDILTYGTTAEQISKTNAFLASNWWVQAYEGATPEQAAALDEWRRTLETRVRSMQEDARVGGEGVVDRYSGSLKGGRGEVGAATTYMTGSMQSAFNAAKEAARAAGYGTGAQYAAGLRATYGLVNDAAYFVGSAIGPLKPSSPPPAVPWIIDAGTELGEMYAGAFADTAPLVRDAAMAVGAAASGLRTASPFAPPSVAPMSFSGYGTLSTVPGPQRVQQNNVTIAGLVKARDPFEISSTLERFQRTGVLAEAPDFE